MENTGKMKTYRIMTTDFKTHILTCKEEDKDKEIEGLRKHLESYDISIMSISEQHE